MKSPIRNGGIKGNTAGGGQELKKNIDRAFDHGVERAHYNRSREMGPQRELM